MQGTSSRGCDALPVQVDVQRVALFCFTLNEQGLYLICIQWDGQQADVQAVVVKDVCEVGSDDGAKAVLRKRPGCVLTRGATAEIFACQKNACSLVTRP